MVHSGYNLVHSGYILVTAVVRCSHLWHNVVLVNLEQWCFVETVAIFLGMGAASVIALVPVSSSSYSSICRLLFPREVLIMFLHDRPQNNGNSPQFGCSWFQPLIWIIESFSPFLSEPGKQLAPLQGPSSSKRVWGIRKGFEGFWSLKWRRLNWLLLAARQLLDTTVLANHAVPNSPQCSVVLFRIVGWKQWTLVGNVIQTAAQRHWESSWVGSPALLPCFHSFSRAREI